MGLGSLPLCAENLAALRLVRPCDEVLQRHESYWAIAGLDAVARAQWEQLVDVLG
jgi:LysR family glycine cleavage system transcriptional activator